MFGIDPTIETTTATIAKNEEVCTTSEDDLCTTTTTGKKEAEVRNTSDNATIDNEFTTSPTIEEDDEKNNNYYDNIDHKILQIEYKGTIVFEEDPLALTTVRTTNVNDTIIKDVSTIVKVDTTKLLHTVVDYFDEKTLEYIYGILLEYPYDDDTKETVCEILMEALSAQDDIVIDGSVVCDSLFASLDMDKQQQQRDTTSANNLPIAISTNTKIRPPTTSTPTNTHK